MLEVVSTTAVLEDVLVTGSLSDSVVGCADVFASALVAVASALSETRVHPSERLSQVSKMALPGRTFNSRPPTDAGAVVVGRIPKVVVQDQRFRVAWLEVFWGAS